MATCDYDFGKTAVDYAQYRASFPDWFFDRLASCGVRFANARAVDLGTGTGLMARALASRGARVVGLDISAPMLEQARRGNSQGTAEIEYVEAPAEATGLPDGAFDLATAATCWHWFDRDQAAKEAHRLLATGGAIVICSLDWLPLPGNLVTATEALVRKHNPQWRMHGGDGLKPNIVHDLRRAGFSDVESFSVDFRIAFDHAAWRGRMRASAGVAASLAPEAVAAFDNQLGELLRRDFPEQPHRVDHCAFAAIGWKGDRKAR